jgi:hypothetical protein
MEYFVSSATGTLCAELITLPICTVKTVYQNSQPNINIKNVVVDIYKTRGGLTGFFQASTPAVISQVLSTAFKYHFYIQCKSIRQTDSGDLLSNSVNGMMGGIMGSFLTHPIDVWKNYVQRGEKYPWTLRALYQGYSGSIAKNVVLYSCLFPLYDYFSIRTGSQTVASVATTLTCSIMVQPVDYYKTVRMSGNTFHGYRNLYRGFFLMVSRSVPHFMITTFVSDRVQRLLLREPASVKRL